MPDVPNPEVAAAGQEAAAEVLADAAEEKVVEAEITAIEAALATFVGVPELFSLINGDDNPLRGMVNLFDQAVGSAIIDPLLFDMMGISRAGIDADSERAVNVIRRVSGFAFTLPAAAAALNFIGKQRFGKAWPETLSEQLKSIPEELGFGFFIGGLLENIYEQVVGKPLEEMINRQTHPNRIDPGTLRALARQKKLTDEEYRDYLEDLGYRDKDKERLLRLNEQQLTVGDIQVAFLDGLLTVDQVQDYLKGLGYADADVALLMNVYLQKGVTEGAATLKGVARGAFANGFISEEQFRATLNSVNVPPISIDLEVKAVQLQQVEKHTNLSLSTLKTAYQDGSLPPDVVIQKLRDLHYADGDINVMIQVWTDESKKSKVGLDVTRILSYEMGGFFNADKAYGMLLALGMRSEDARFLADNPTAHPATFRYPLNPDEIGTALQEQVITLDDAQHLLLDQSIDPTEARLILQIAIARQTKVKKPKEPHKEMSEGEMKSAMAYGLMTIGTVTSELVRRGYSDTDAHIITAIWIADLTGHKPDGFQAI